MKYDTVIWDFNGTLIDDMELGISAANVMLRARGLSEITGTDEYRERFFFPVEKYYESLGFDFEREPYNDLAREWFDMYLAGEGSLVPMAEATEALEIIRDAGLRQIVLSASESSLLISQIERFGFSDYFDDIIGKDDFLADGKVAAAKKRLGDKNHNCAMIGDTSHDYATAVAIGADPYLFSGGHESAKRLSATGAPVCNSLTELCRLILLKK